MLRIFSDNISAPVFAMMEVPGNETLEYLLPSQVRVVSFPMVLGAKKIIDTCLGFGLTDEIRNVIDDCYAVYLRQPLWICWDVFKYALSRKKKIIASYHGDWVDYYRKKEVGLIKHCFWAGFSIYIDHILKTIARHSEVLFCVGKSLADRYGSLAKETIIFANFLHSMNDIVVPRALCSKPPYNVLYVGILEQMKGIKYLIKAIGVLKTKGFDIDLTIVGAGPLQKSLISAADSAGSAENVKFRQYIQYGKELMQVYHSSDIFVLPSISGEGTPKVLMEAMSQGIPVIATDVGSSRYLLENGKYGILVQPKDVSSIVSAIQKLIEDKNLRTRLVNEGLKLARSCTKEKQEEIVRNGLKGAIPEIVGVPVYLREIDEA